MKNLKWLMSLTPKAKKYLILGITFCIVNSLLSLTPPLLIAKSIDNAVANTQIKISPIQNNCSNNHCLYIPQIITAPDYHPIISYLIIALIIYLICAIIDYLQNLFMYRLATNITYQLRQKVNEKIFNLPAIQYDKSTNGEITSLVINDIEAINTSLASDLSEAISAILTFLGTIIIMFTISIKLSLTIIITIPICFIILLLILSRGEKYFKKYQEDLAKYNSFIEESYTGLSIIKHHNVTTKFIAKHQNINQELKHSSKMSQFISSLMYPLTSLISNLTFIITCLLGSISLIQNKISLGTLQAFISYAKNINEPLLNLSSLTTTLETINAATNHLYNFLDLPNEHLLKETNYQLQGNISFQDIDFSYDSQTVLHKINISIHQGEKIAIIGPTGSGKSTIVKLLLKFYQPTSGSITIDNIPLNKISNQNLRNNIAYIPQDFFLTSASIKDNLIFNQNINPKLYQNALNLITTSPDNFYNPEQNNLSTGEKQLITIARAYLKNAPILILDEATSNIDSHTEKKVTAALDKLMQNKTSIIIAHRLNTIKKCDQIIVLKDGHIVEIGTHQQLLKNKSFYYHMYH